MSRTDGLDIAAVIKQFDESEELLSGLRDRLRSIVDAEETADRASSAVSEAATALAGFTQMLNGMAAELAEARSATVSALEAARRFLEGVDLESIRRSITDLGKEVGAQGASLRQDVADLAAAVPKIEEQQKLLDAARAELAAVKALVPARKLRQAGLA